MVHDLDPGLLRAVLDDAIEVYRHPRSYRRHARRLLVDTERWIASDDCTGPFDFRNVCGALGIDAEELRMTLRRERPETPRPTRGFAEISRAAGR